MFRTSSVPAVEEEGDGRGEVGEGRGEEEREGEREEENNRIRRRKKKSVNAGAAVEKRTSAWMILKLVEQKEYLWTTEEFHTWLHGLRKNLNS